MVETFQESNKAQSTETHSGTDSSDHTSVSPHEHKEQARQKRQEEFLVQENKRKKQVLWKKRRNWAVAILVLAALAWYAATTMRSSSSYTSGEVHWHALLEMQICGKNVNLPRLGDGEHHLGLPLLHTHDDNTIHVEGQVFRKEDIVLGKFMDAVGVPFSTTQLFDKHNGDVCPGTDEPGVLRMSVDNKPSADFRDYVIQPTTDGNKQVIRLSFGAES